MQELSGRSFFLLAEKDVRESFLSNSITVNWKELVLILGL